MAAGARASTGERGWCIWHDTHMDQAELSNDNGTGVTPLGHEVYEIDTRMAGYRQITAGYLIRADRPCLVETGTAPSAPVVRDALAGLGVGPSDLATVVVTHIHLDHAGGVGDIATMFPGGRDSGTRAGRAHLADPSRLMASARMVYGEALDSLFGELKPTAAERIRSVERRGSIDLGGGRSLNSHYSPGHAKHHVGLIDSASGDLYVGDAAGVFVPETRDLRPASPPPGLRPPAGPGLAAAVRGAGAHPAAVQPLRPVDDVGPTLERSAEELNVWVDETRRARNEGLDLDHTVAMVRERTRHRYRSLAPDADQDISAKAERVSSTEANVEGILHWLGKTWDRYSALSRGPHFASVRSVCPVPTGPLLRLPRGPLLLRLSGFGQIVDDDAVQVLVALAGVGVLSGVQGGGVP